MPIKYFPNRVFKKSVPAIDRVMAQRNPLVTRGTVDITTNGIDQRITNNTNWQVDSIQFNYELIDKENTILDNLVNLVNKLTKISKLNYEELINIFINNIKTKEVFQI